MNGLITVILNVYNGEKYVKKCLDSIINQTYKNLEILIINDGSTDNTLKIINEYKDNRIRIITTNNLGLSLSRNVGIDNAKGEYIYFIDVDDYIELDTIEYLYGISKQYDVKISTCETIIVYNKPKINNIKEKINVETNLTMIKKVLLSKGRHGAIWNKLIKREMFNDLRFEDRIINDIVVVYKLLLKTDKIGYSNQKKYYYLKHQNSITGKRNPDRAIDSYKASIERYNNIDKIYPNMLENKISILVNIIDVYNHNNEITDTYLKEEHANKTFKKLFSIKILKTNLNTKEKIKIILYRTNPKIERFFQKHKKRY